MLISGVGQAATSRKQSGFKAAFGKKLGQAVSAVSKTNAGMYRLSVETLDEQNKWVRALMQSGLGGDIEEAQRIEAEQKAEREAEERVMAERVKAEEEAAAERMAEELFAGSAEGGGARPKVRHHMTQTGA